MSDPITFERDGKTMVLLCDEVTDDVAYDACPADATDVDLRAAGYVPMGEIVNFDDFVDLAKRDPALKAQVLKAVLPSAEELAKRTFERLNVGREHIPWEQLNEVARQFGIERAEGVLKALTGGEER